MERSADIEGGAPTVEVYYNLHRGCLSWRHTGGRDRVHHAAAVLLGDVRFAVQPAGHARVRREKRKNVHAFVRGGLVYVQGLDGEDLPHTVSRFVGGPRVTYDPYVDASFVVLPDREPIRVAPGVLVAGKNIYLLGEFPQWADGVR